MKTVKKIFFDDIISLAKNFFALVIVVGICFLPALYAWFNIYSNWDPYGNTGALKIAAVSLDEGFTDDKGEYHNQGDTIIENLHENTAVNWQFVETADEAIEGVYSGEYYAAVVVDKDFTYDMYNVLTEEVNRPTLNFYENQKKNPVATKISDTVVQSLQNNINVAFTEVVVSRVFEGASNVSSELEERGGVDATINKLKTLSTDLTNYQNTINSIIENDAKLKESLAVAETDANNLGNQAFASANAIKNSAGVSSDAKTTLNTYSEDVNATVKLINTKMSQMNQYIDVAETTEDVQVMASAVKQMMITAAEIEALVYSLPEQLGSEKLENVNNNVLPYLRSIQNINKYISGQEDPQIAQLISDIEEVNKAIDFGNNQVKSANKKIKLLKEVDETAFVNEGSEKMQKAVKHSKSDANDLGNYIINDLNPKVNAGLDSLTGMLNDTNSLLNQVGETFGNLVVMFNAIDNTIDCANTSLEKTNESIAYVNGRLIEVIDKVDSAASNDKLKVLINSLSGDPEVYGKFFSTPVQVETEAVYPVENYGSAVAPFYSTLAFWVGALILTAIIKIKPDKNKYPEASERQLFFGRYVLYWILGQIQAVVIVLGDLFLLHVQCIHPWLFMLAASVIATTFTILIYSLVVTWGDVGKALSVVIVVIQIAGSSGTYPIELLPDFFKKVYIFFPFPYAINAIRECLCGMYELDYLKYLGCLVIFMAVALVIGLLVRIPFEPINHYMEERMEDTEMM